MGRFKPSAAPSKLFFMKGITLIGMAGVGKSAVGQIMAGVLDWQFWDLDKVILGRQGMSHHEYMKRNGEQALSLLEEQYALSLDLQNSVFAPPGSMVYSPKAMQKIKADSVVVYLEARPETIAERLGERLYKNGIIGLEKKGLTGVMAERIPLYEKYADFTIHSGNQTKEDMAKKIIAALQAQGIKLR
jgi:shikimate kinase